MQRATTVRNLARDDKATGKSKVIPAATHDGGRRKSKTVQMMKDAADAARHVNSEIMILHRTEEEMANGTKYRGVFHPASRIRRSWDIMTGFFVLYLSWAIPFLLAFEWYFPGPSIKIFHQFLDIWFVLDIALHFRTGFVKYGAVTMNPKSIAHHYTHSYWFAIDVMASLPVEHLFSDPRGSVYRKAIKILKYVKLPKLLRFGRETKSYKKYSRYAGLLKLFGGFVLLTHLSSCFWVYLVRPCSEEVDELCDPEFVYDMYFMAVHFGMLALLGVSDDLVTGTTHILFGGYKEKNISSSIYMASMVITVGGLTFIALLFGNVVFLVQSWNRSSNMFRKKMDQVEYEMEYLNVPGDLRTRIKTYYDYIYINRQNLGSKLIILQENGMSKPLRQRVAIHIYKDLLLKTSLFHEASDGVLGMICEMINRVIYMPDEMICRKGELGKDFFIIAKGLVCVLPNEEEAVRNTVLLTEGAFFGEIGIIMDVERTRTVVAKSITELCILNRQDFSVVFKEFPEFATKVKELVIQRSQSMFSDQESKERQIFVTQVERIVEQATKTNDTRASLVRQKSDFGMLAEIHQLNDEITLLKDAINTLVDKMAK